MLALVYELLYTLTVALGVASMCVVPAAGLGTVSAAGIVITMASAGALTCFRNMRWMGRSVMAGVMIAMALSVRLLMRNELLAEWFMAHAGYLWLLVAGVGAWTTGELMAQLRPVRITLAVAMGLFLVIRAVTQIHTEKLTVVSGLGILLLVLVEEIQRSWQKTGHTDSRGHLVWVSPFLVLTMMLVYMSPAPDEAYDWAFVRRIINDTYERIQEISILLSINRNVDSAEANMGFDGRGNISGQVKEQDEEVMEVNRISRGIAGVQLAGKTFSQFDGRMWLDTDTSVEPDAVLDTLSLLASVEEYTQTPGDLLRRSTLQVRYIRLHTAYVFVPLKAVSTIGRLREAGVRYAGGDLMWPLYQTFDTTYEIPYYRLNTGNEAFMEYLRSARMPSQEAYERAASQLLPGEMGACSYADLLRYREHIISTYAEPVTLSEELRTLMDSVYEGAETDCDRMDRLEKMLRGLQYTEEPGPLPQEVDSPSRFLEELLLNRREGYCSHFATAFVLLARAEGLPARYVQGYKAITNGASGVIVTSAMAHAWPEVWYEGAGWIAYEPTPLYGTRPYWRTEAELRQQAEEAGMAYEAYAEQQEEMYLSGAEETGQLLLTEEDAAPEKGIMIPWFALVVPLAVGIVLVVLLFLLGRLIAWIRFRRMTGEERFRTLCRQDMLLLGLLGMGMEEAETLREYGVRIREGAGEENTTFLFDLERHLYGAPSVEMDAAETSAGQTRQRLMDRLRHEHFIRYLGFRGRYGQ